MNVAFWCGCAAALAVTVNLVSLVTASIRIRRRPASAAPEPVSIVRPVCGLEAFSEETLRAGFLLEGVEYELIFCVARSDDPVVPLVRRLMAQYPHIPSRLIEGDVPISANPKLNNCVAGWDAARHDWVVLADSNVLMPRNYVQRLRASWRPDTGLVCSTPAGSRPDGFWAEVECAFLNSLQARWQYAGEALGLGFAQGKSMLWWKPFLEERGGIRALGAEIAEDAAATKLVRGAGLRVHLVDSPFEQPLGRREAAEVWFRQLRWARLRRVTFPLFFAPELFSGAVLPAAGASYAAFQYGHSPALAAALVLLLWWGPESLLARRVGWFLSWRSPFAYAARDLAVIGMWVSAWVAAEIVWRGNVMTITTKPGAAQVSADGSAA